MRMYRNFAFVLLMFTMASTAALRADEPDFCGEEVPPTTCQWTYEASSCTQDCSELCSDWYEDSTGEETGCTIVSPDVKQLCYCYLEGEE